MKMRDRSRRNFQKRAGSPLFGVGAAARRNRRMRRSNEQAGKMTSFSTTESAANKAELFSVPADQMSHIQIYAVAKAPLGAYSAAYRRRCIQRLPDDAGDHAGRRSGESHHGRSGRTGEAGATDAIRNQPGLFAAALGLSESAGRLCSSPTAFTSARRICMRTKPSPRPIWSKPNRRAARRRPTWNPASKPCACWAFPNPDDLIDKTARAEVALAGALAGEVVERLCSPGQLLQAGGTQCFTLSDMSSVWMLVNIYQNDVPYVHVGDEVTIENEAYPGTDARQNPIRRSRPGSHHAHAAGAHRSRQSRRAAEERHVRHGAGACGRDSQRLDRAGRRRCCATRKTCPTSTCKPANNQFARRDGDAGRKPERQNARSTSGLQAGDHVVGDGSLFLQFQNSLQR